MHDVNIGRKSPADYRSIVPRELMSELDELAAQLRGCRVLHVDATAFGGAVGGIPLQIEDGVTARLVSSAAECAARCGAWRCSPSRRSTSAWPRPARRTCGASSSRLAFCAMICASSATCARVE